MSTEPSITTICPVMVQAINEASPGTSVSEIAVEFTAPTLHYQSFPHHHESSSDFFLTPLIPQCPQRVSQVLVVIMAPLSSDIPSLDSGDCWPLIPFSLPQTSLFLGVPSPSFYLEFSELPTISQLNTPVQDEVEMVVNIVLKCEVLQS